MTFLKKLTLNGVSMQGANGKTMGLFSSSIQHTKKKSAAQK